MKTSKICVLAAAALMTDACDNEKYEYDASRLEQMQKEQFTQSFIKHFGQIAPNQSWDFAGSPLISIAGPERRSTRAIGTTNVTCTPDNGYMYLDADGYYEIPAAMQSSLNDIKENKDNGNLGSVYTLSIPANNFTIIPIRQGYTNSTYELHMVVGSGENAVDYLLWKKGNFMQTRKAGSTERWKNTADAEKSFTYGNFDVRTKVLTFTDMPVDEPMYFYLSRPKNGNYPSSLEGFMKDFTDIVYVPEQFIEDGKKVKVLGAEGQWDPTLTDLDYEDVMFMIVGDPELPGEIEQMDKMKFTQTVTKRYMIEDLGNSDDTDYNDVVVDMESTRSIAFEYDTTNGKITNRIYGNWENQTATIRHLGGTLPFMLTIGDKNLGWMAGQMDANPNTVFDITGWNPDTNNISITVRQTGNGDGVSSITFPAVGSVPLIIATNTSQPWMKERVSIIPTLKSLVINQKSGD